MNNNKNNNNNTNFLGGQSSGVDLKNILPGFCMGITRSVISHPFEIMKIKSQLNHTKDFHKNLYKGLHYSMIANGIERGAQFFLYDYFRNGNNSNLLSSLKASSLSTLVATPYNYLIVNKSVVNQDIGFSFKKLSKTIPLEYTRTFLASSIFLYTYNELKTNSVPLWLSAFGGTTAVWTFTYPLDNIRNQIISGNNNFNILRLYKGVHYPVFRSLPSSIAGMYVYEKVKEYVLD